jgi:ABC-type Zn uptake system ZnuABC Zn-binding protein ZnuA
VETYTANATAYVAQLEELHAWTEQQLSGIPNENRILITSHDSLSYFAVVYGFEVVGTIIPGGTTETESSAEQLAELIEIVEHEGVQGIFGETTVTERIARAVAEETGAEFYSLYSGSLGAAGSGADTYITMVRSNVELIAEALS